MTLEDLGAIYAYLRTLKPVTNRVNKHRQQTGVLAMAFEYLTGVYNITPTPFHPGWNAGRSELEKMTAFTRGTGVNGMTILGVLGEADKPIDSERDRVIEIVIDEAGRIFRFVGTTTPARTVASRTASARSNWARGP